MATKLTCFLSFTLLLSMCNQSLHATIDRRWLGVAGAGAAGSFGLKKLSDYNRELEKFKKRKLQRIRKEEPGFVENVNEQPDTPEEAEELQTLIRKKRLAKILTFAGFAVGILGAFSASKEGAEELRSFREHEKLDRARSVRAIAYNANYFVEDKVHGVTSYEPVSSHEVANKANDIVKLKSIGNKLIPLPRAITKFKNLKILDLSRKRLSLRKMTSLFDEGRGLKELPKWIGDMVSLEHIDLSGNKLVSLPSEIEKLKNLKVLDLNDNKLTSIPIEIGQLKHLKILNISGNPLSEMDFNTLTVILKNFSRGCVVNLSFAGFTQNKKDKIRNMRSTELIKAKVEFFQDETRDKLRKEGVPVF